MLSAISCSLIPPVPLPTGIAARPHEQRSSGSVRSDLGDVASQMMRFRAPDPDRRSTSRACADRHRCETAKAANALLAGLILRVAPLLLVACTSVEARPPIVAPSGPEATLDPGEGAVIHDDARRHAPPAEAVRRRVYAVERSLVRWGWRGGERAFPADRVALVGSPPPLPGQRFVLFDEEGPYGVVEATGERCPPGHEDCVVCEVDDPLRRHWARHVGRPPEPSRRGSALGPFAPEEPLPAPRALDGEWRARGLWSIRLEDDLDGDGTGDRARAVFDCRPGRPGYPGCRSRREVWRRHDGRWFAEPQAMPSPAPMHMVAVAMFKVDPGLWSTWILPWFGGEVPPGEYAVVTRRGVVGTIRHAAVKGDGEWCLVEGESCRALDGLVRMKQQFPQGAMGVGPVPAGIHLRVRRLLDARSDWAPWVVVERDDGRRWAMSRFPCDEVTDKRAESGSCYEVREDGGGPAVRWLTMVRGEWAEQVCGRLAEPPPVVDER